MELDTEVFGQLLGILDRSFRRKLRGHHQSPHVLRPQRCNRQTSDHGGVDTARNADTGLFIPIFNEEIPQTATSRLVNEAGTVVHRHRDGLDAASGIFGIEHLKVLFETFQQPHQLAPVVHHARHPVVNQLRSTADLIDHHHILSLDVGDIPDYVVPTTQVALAVAAGMDVDDGFDRLVEIRGMKKIVAYDQRTAATPYRNVFATFRRGQKSQFAAHGDILFSHVADDSSLLNQRCGTDRPLLGENRKPHDRIHRIAFGGNPHQRIFALFQKRIFPQQIERRSTADRLLGKNDEVCAFGFRTTYGFDDLVCISCDVADRIIQLSQSYLHLSGISKSYIIAKLIIIWKKQRFRGKSFIRTQRSYRKKAIGVSKSSFGKEAVPVSTQRIQPDLPWEGRATNRSTPNACYCCSSGSATRIRPQYSQMMIFLP